MKKQIAIVLAIILGASLGCTVGFAENSTRTQLTLSGKGWSLWRDTNASWKNEPLFAPPVDLRQVPANPPTGGWNQLNKAKAIPVSVPGTVEEYCVQNPDPNETRAANIYTKLQGVSWWFRTVHIPQSAQGKRLLLQFGAIRLRAEVYVNQKLVAYDLVGNTPFEADITESVRAGEDFQLAVRVTNPGGNLDWEDFRQFKWGSYDIPYSHAFGGITGDVSLLAVDPTYVSDVYVQNTPAVRKVNVFATITNTTSYPLKRDLLVRVAERKHPGAEVFRREIKDIEIAPGNRTLSVEVSVPDAKLWDLDHPNLYVCETSLKSGKTVTDRVEHTFGFRWFAPEGQGSNAVFRLNGKRIVLRTAISWGYWPLNGITPTPELAERQIRLAKQFGLNMLNFHRCIGQPVVLDKADELGLLYYEEPGGYCGGGTNAFGQALAREKLFRMIKRDRNHPSLVIFNMINEQWDFFGADKNKSLQENYKKDIQAAHELDPSRTITFASSWARGGEESMFVKMHMRPFDDGVYFTGWHDFHRAGGPDTWQQSFYADPEHNYMLTKDAREIVYWGEEGAISSPPQLGRIKAELAKSPHPGWDGEIYLDWFKKFDDFLTRKNLRDAFHSVDDICTAMGNMSLEHQGRKIQEFRICDLNDGYAVNGWEAMPFENHSGIVDEFRNSKGDPAILAYYNQPLYVAVEPRRQIYQPGETATVDFYAINENNLHGEYELKISGIDSSGQEVFSESHKVALQGGETYGQLLVEGVKMPLSGAAGLYHIRVRLVDDRGKAQAKGRDEVLVVNWKSSQINGKGAVYEAGHEVGDYLKHKGVEAASFDGTQKKLVWLVVARPPRPSLQPIGSDNLLDADGKLGGLTATFFNGDNFEQPLARRTDKKLWFDVDGGAAPDPNVALIENYSVRWEGKIVPPTSGNYDFNLERGDRDDRSRLFIDGKCVIDGWKSEQTQGKTTLELSAGKPVAVRVEFYNHQGSSKLHLTWLPPNQISLDPVTVLKRTVQDGTTIILADYADEWMDALAAVSNVKCAGKFSIGTNWRGGQYFVKSHPLFKGLPVNVALNWPYQGVIKSGRSRYALMMDGEELVCGGYQTMGCQLGTVVGVVTCGKGKMIVSTLDICPHLNDPSGPADVARKLFCNYLEFGAKH